MRYALPINSSDEVSKLYFAGADELYCGYFDDIWQETFGRHDSISRRQGMANFTSWNELKKAVAESLNYKMPVNLTLNARYTEGQYSFLIDLIEKWISIGGNGIIVRDIGLLSRIKKENLDSELQIIVSLLFPVVNQYTVPMLKDFGVSRIVLPRHIDIIEMDNICHEFKEIEFECMVMGDKCRMIDGFCRSIHGESCSFVNRDNDFSDIGFFNGCNHLCMQYGQPEKDPCAVCKLNELENAGISVGKIGGRGLPLEKRIQWLKFIKSTEKLNNKQKKAEYENTFSHGCNCYYEKKGEEKTFPKNNIDYLKSDMLGHHSCIKALDDILAYLSDCKQKKDKKIFVFPPITAKHFGKFKKIIHLLSGSVSESTAELVLNDYGALAFCNDYINSGKLNAKLTAGLLLSGQDTDPYYYLLNSRKNSIDMFIKHLSTPSVISDLDFLKRNGVCCIELCNQPFFSEEIKHKFRDFTLRFYDISVLSVKPCNNDCINCGEKTIIRNGRKVLSNRNLIYY